MISRALYMAETRSDTGRLEWATDNGRMISLGIVTLFGCVIVFLLVFDVAPLRSVGLLPESLRHWQGWELAALAWTFTFTIVYFLDFPYVPDRPKINKLISLLSLLPVILTVPAAYYLLANRYFLHFLFVLALGVLLFLTDNLLYVLHDDPGIKLQYLESTLLADFPMIVALGALGIYLWSFGTVPTEDSEVFLAGAIAFQLVASNAIFVLIQSRVMQKFRERLTESSAPHASSSTRVA